MDPLELNDIITFGTATVITIILLRMTFKFLRDWQERQYKNEDDGKNARGRKSSVAETTDYSVINNQLLKQMALQIEDMHETISVTKSFQRAFSSMAASAADQTQILKELSDINQKNFEILEYLAKMTVKIDADRVKQGDLEQAVTAIKKDNGKKER